MKSRTPLVLMEQMVMLLVFALAAALCLQVFVRSDNISKDEQSLCRAAFLCQSSAEVIRSCGGDTDSALAEAAEKLDCRFENGVLSMELDEEWNPVSGGGCRLRAAGVPCETAGLNTVLVTAERGGETVFEIEVAWQEVPDRG